MLFTLLGMLVAIAITWFIPWVFTLHLGFLAYFPYLPKSEERYLRVTGPLSGPYRKNWVPSADIPRACKLALVAAEDTKFFIHHGVDIESIEKSYEYNQRKKKAKRGGSTITQQLVKNAFLSRERSYLRKAREMVGAVLLDATSSKDLQLTWYFNIVEFGPKVYGIKDAAQFYFKKSHKALSNRECASLVAILPSPNRWNKSLKAGSPSGFLASRIGTIQARMKMIPTDEESKAVLSASRSRKQGGGATPAKPPAEGARNQPSPQLKDLELQAEQAEELDLPEAPVEPETFYEPFGLDQTPAAAPPPQAVPAPPQDSEIGTPSGR
jgi:monofunctional biosynthetic peptidoglycan transglycosylase